MEVPCTHASCYCTYRVHIQYSEQPFPLCCRARPQTKALEGSDVGDSRQHALISQPRKMNGLAFVKVNHREIQLNNGALKRHSNIY